MSQFRLVPSPGRKAVRHEMSFFRVAAVLTSLFFFSVFAVAQISVPNCTLHIGQWVCISRFRQYIHSLANLIPCIQAYNSLGESPCTILGYMMETCSSDDSGEFFFSCLRVRVRVLCLSFCRVRDWSNTRPGMVVCWPGCSQQSQHRLVPMQYHHVLALLCMRCMSKWELDSVRLHCVLFSTPGGLCIFF